MTRGHLISDWYFSAHYLWDAELSATAAVVRTDFRLARNDCAN
jgi:hypothetical protein